MPGFQQTEATTLTTLGSDHPQATVDVVPPAGLFLRAPTVAFDLEEGKIPHGLVEPQSFYVVHSVESSLLLEQDEKRRERVVGKRLKLDFCDVPSSESSSLLEQNDPKLLQEKPPPEIK